MCLEGLAGKDPVKMPCGHVICLLCVTNWIERERTCPLCKQDVPDDFKLSSSKSIRYNALIIRSTTKDLNSFLNGVELQSDKKGKGNFAAKKRHAVKCCRGTCF